MSDSFATEAETREPRGSHHLYRVRDGLEPTFRGIPGRVDIKWNEKSNRVSLHFKDWTALFLEAKNFPDANIEWTDTLQQAWSKICDHTGYWDPEEEKIVSSVEQLKYALVFSDPSLKTRTLGDLASERFHALSKPTPKKNSTAWAVWQWIVQSMALISYVDRDQVIVTRIQDHFSEEKSPTFLYGENILGLNEKADLRHATKGVLLRSFDPLRGTPIESHYPPPGDPRVKHPKNNAGKPGAKSRVTKDPLNDYEPFNWSAASTQESLDRRARGAYEERRRQELQGTLKTRRMVTHDVKGNELGSILDLMPGDTIRVDVDRESRENFRGFESDTEKVAYLVQRGYTPDAAKLIVLNTDKTGQFEPVFHVGSLGVRLAENSFDVEIRYHNQIKVTALS